MTAAETRMLVAGAERFGVEPDADVLARVGRFLALLAVWNRRLRLTSDREPRQVIERHVLDSLAPVPFLPPRGLVIDIGSGAGFPGIILGCARPDLELGLIESRRRRTSFLREAIRSIPLPRARALEVRAEAAGKDPALAGRAAVVIGRAIRLDLLLGLATPLLAERGEVIAMQTPRTATKIERAADTRELRLARRHDYSLGSAGARTLLIFARKVS